MIRKIVKIDAEKCNGCGACAKACLEDAIAIIDGKAVLLRDDYCDGLGNCLPVCPMDAIGFEEREAAAFDEEAVKRNQEMKKQGAMSQPIGASCSGIKMQSFARPAVSNTMAGNVQSELRQWPVQIKLAPVQAPYFDNADVLIAADCSAYAYGNFHADFIRGRVTLIGCPKLDAVDYSEKLTAIFAQNNIKSLLLARMEVPCCGGMQKAVQIARDNSGKQIPVRVVTISAQGQIVKEEIV
ncbi:MAG: 4Fe-4S binding protein [Peptococcaceae bacterium]|nr:4Fe-4S binding protein [Peptococcaceae bacterium]